MCRNQHFVHTVLKTDMYSIHPSLKQPEHAWVQISQLSPFVQEDSLSEYHFMGLCYNRKRVYRKKESIVEVKDTQILIWNSYFSSAKLWPSYLNTYYNKTIIWPNLWVQIRPFHKDQNDQYKSWFQVWLVPEDLSESYCRNTSISKSTSQSFLIATRILISNSTQI